MSFSLTAVCVFKSLIWSLSLSASFSPKPLFSPFMGRKSGMRTRKRLLTVCWASMAVLPVTGNANSTAATTPRRRRPVIILTPGWNPESVGSCGPPLEHRRSFRRTDGLFRAEGLA